METEYLSIKDFAKKAGVSQQALYKRLNNPNNQLNNYVKVVENQKMIDIRALQEVYGVEIEQPIQPKIQPVEQPIQPILQATIESLTKELERKSEELKAKDKQYSDLVASMNEQLKAKDRQIEKEQELNARNQSIIKELTEEKQRLLEVREPIEPIQEPVEPDEPPTEETPKGFWSRFFKK